MRSNVSKYSVVSFIIAFVLMVSVIGAFQACRHPEATPLGTVEVQQYEGQDLSSIKDLGENSINGPQQVNLADYRLQVDGLVKRPVSYTYNEVIDDFASFSKVVRLKCVEGWSVDMLWQGVLVRDLLAKARVPPEAKVVIFHAYDEYTTSLPIEYIVDNNILLAYGMNGVALPPEHGFPFQLVAESKWGYKWIKWVTRIEVSDNTSYRGYWEKRGFSNEGDLNNPSVEQ